MRNHISQNFLIKKLLSQIKGITWSKYVRFIKLRVFLDVDARYVL